MPFILKAQLLKSYDDSPTFFYKCETQRMLMFDSSLKLIDVLKAVCPRHHKALHRLILPAAQFSILIQHACIFHYSYSIQQVYFKLSWLQREAHEMKIFKGREKIQ